MDNRTEAPARVPGDGPGGMSAADGPDEAEPSATQDSQADAAEQQAGGAAGNGEVSGAAVGWQSEAASDGAASVGADAGGDRVADKAQPSRGKKADRTLAEATPAAGPPAPPAQPPAADGAAADTSADSGAAARDHTQLSGDEEPAPVSTYDVFRPAAPLRQEVPATPASGGPAYSPLPPDPPPSGPVAAAAQTSPLPSVAAVADGVRDVASRVSSSFSGGLARLSERTSQFRAGGAQRTAPTQPQPAPPEQPVTSPAAPGPQAPRPQVSRPPVARPQVRPAPGASRGQPRRALLRLERLEPWSVMKFSFLISLVCWVIFFIVVAVLYLTLSKLGVFHAIEQNWNLVTSNKSNQDGSRISEWLSGSRILGYTMIIGAMNVVLMTALATIGAVLYNLITTVTGGIEVTLKESD